MQRTRHIPAVPSVCYSCAGNGLAHPHPLGSTCEKGEQRLDQHWFDRHGQEFLDHEMWLDSVISATEVNEEDSCICLLPVQLFIEVVEKSQYGVSGVPVL